MQFKKLASTLLLATIFTPQTHAQTTCFPDTDQDTNIEFICKLKNDNIVNGYTNGNFGPNNYLTRAELSKFVTKRFFNNQTNSNCTQFPDITLSNIFYDNILNLKCNNIINGYEDKTFKPQNNVTRGEAIKFVVNSIRKSKNNSNLLPATNQIYQDFPKTNVFYSFNGAINNNYLLASTDNYVRPNDFITRSEMARLVEGGFGGKVLCQFECLVGKIGTQPVQIKITKDEGAGASHIFKSGTITYTAAGNTPIPISWEQTNNVSCGEEGIYLCRDIMITENIQGGGYITKDIRFNTQTMQEESGDWKWSSKDGRTTIIANLNSTTSF